MSEDIREQIDKIRNLNNLLNGQSVDDVAMDEMARITKKDGKAYADGEPLENFIDPEKVDLLERNLIIYHETQGNPFIPKDQIYLWFVDRDDYIDKLNSEEYGYVFFPIRHWGNAFHVSPIDDVWKISKAKGKNHVLGIIRAQIKNDDLVIEMMSVRGPWQRNKINSIMINTLRDAFPDKNLTFEDPTEDGYEFIDAYAPDAKVVNGRGDELHRY